MAPVIKGRPSIRTYTGRKPGKPSIAPQTFNSTFDDILGVENTKNIFESSSEREPNFCKSLDSPEYLYPCPFVESFDDDKSSIPKNLKKQLKKKNCKAASTQKKKKPPSRRKKSDVEFNEYIKKVYRQELSKRKCKLKLIKTPNKQFFKAIGSTPKRSNFTGGTLNTLFRQNLNISSFSQFFGETSSNVSSELPSAISLENSKDDSVQLSKLINSFQEVKLKYAKNCSSKIFIDEKLSPVQSPCESENCVVNEILPLSPRISKAGSIGNDEILSNISKRGYSSADSLVKISDSFEIFENLKEAPHKSSLKLISSVKLETSPESGNEIFNQSKGESFLDKYDSEGVIQMSCFLEPSVNDYSPFNRVTFRRKHNTNSSSSKELSDLSKSLINSSILNNQRDSVNSESALDNCFSRMHKSESSPSSSVPPVNVSVSDNDDVISSEDGSSDSSTAYQDASEESLESSDHLSCPPSIEKKIFMKTRSLSCEITSPSVSSGEFIANRPPVRRQLSDQSQFSRLDSTLSTMKTRSQRRAQESAQKTRRMKKYQSEGSLLYKKRSTLEFQKSRLSWQPLDDSPSPPNCRADYPLPSLLEIQEHSALVDDDVTSSVNQGQSFHGFTNINISKSRKSYITKRHEVSSLEYSLPVLKEDDKLEISGSAVQNNLSDSQSDLEESVFPGFNESSVLKTVKSYSSKRLNEMSPFDYSLPAVPEVDHFEQSGESSCDDTLDDTSSRAESRASSSRQESPTSTHDIVSSILENTNEFTSPCQKISTNETSASDRSSLHLEPNFQVVKETPPRTIDSPDSSSHSSPSNVKSSESRRQETESPASSRHGSPTSPVTRETASSSEDESGSSPVRHKDLVRRSDRRQGRPSRLSKRTLGYIAEESESESALSELDDLPGQEQFYFLPGKRYRRSLSIFHQLCDEKVNTSLSEKGRRFQDSVDEVIKLQGRSEKRVKQSLVYLSPKVDSKHVRQTTMTNIRRKSSAFPFNDTSVLTDFIEYSITPCIEKTFSIQSTTCLPPALDDNEDGITYEAVVKNLCGQDKSCTFDEIFNENITNCKKIGEGVFGEVFALSRGNQQSVLKIIPIEGDIRVNGEPQKTYDEIFSELVITERTSGLHTRDDFRCNGFVQLLNCWVIVGSYPENLIQLWKEYDEEKGSDNDCPTLFPENQLYLCLELSNAGQNLEEYRFSSAKQGLSAFKQVVFSLAVAEAAFEFEHRDLHWGNILISRTAKKVFHFSFGDESFEVKTNGVKATIIDYTLSRITCGEDFIIFNDVGKDPDIFTGKGDLQFEVYRQMKNDLENDWSRFIPKTNVRWLYYLIDKLIERVHYQRKTAGVHLSSIAVMKEVRSWIQDCENALSVAMKISTYK